MRTRGHMEGSNRYQGLLGGGGEVEHQEEQLMVAGLNTSVMGWFVQQTPWHTFTSVTSLHMYPGTENQS